MDHRSPGAMVIRFLTHLRHTQRGGIASANVPLGSAHRLTSRYFDGKLYDDLQPHVD